MNTVVPDSVELSAEEAGRYSSPDFVQAINRFNNRTDRESREEAVQSMVQRARLPDEISLARRMFERYGHHAAWGH
ncbi:MAG: hypothetical protein WCF94_02485 [bacterium]